MEKTRSLVKAFPKLYMNHFITRPFEITWNFLKQRKKVHCHSLLQKKENFL